MSTTTFPPRPHTITGTRPGGPTTAMFTDPPRTFGPGFDLPRLGKLAPPIAVLRFERGPRAGQQFVLARDTITVLGRHAECDIALQDVSVSRQHAEIQLTHDRCVLRDTGSFTGTYLNYQPVDTTLLTDGDEVTIGFSRFTVHTPGPRAATPAHRIGITRTTGGHGTGRSRP